MDKIKRNTTLVFSDYLAGNFTKEWWLMLKLTLDRHYKAAIYLRLSREDGDFSCSSEKLESNSISNQRLVIMDYLRKCPEITFVREYCDDGYTGANFDRPVFQR